MDSEPQPVGEPAGAEPPRKGLAAVLIVGLVVAIVALLALIAGTLATAYAPSIQTGLQEFQRELGQLQHSVIPAWPPRELPTAASACPEQAVLAYEGRATALDQKATQSAQAAYTAYTQLIQVSVPYCLVTLKNHHVKLFYSRYMAARAIANGNIPEAQKYADEIDRYLDLATAERARLAAQYGWATHK